MRRKQKRSRDPITDMNTWYVAIALHYYELPCWLMIPDGQIDRWIAVPMRPCSGKAGEFERERKGGGIGIIRHLANQLRTNSRCMKEQLIMNERTESLGHSRNQCKRKDQRLQIYWRSGNDPPSGDRGVFRRWGGPPPLVTSRWTAHARMTAVWYVSIDPLGCLLAVWSRLLVSWPVCLSVYLPSLSAYRAKQWSSTELWPLVLIQH